MGVDGGGDADVGVAEVFLVTPSRTDTRLGAAADDAGVP